MSGAPPLRAISFDLDDTLWEIGPVIVRAEQELRDWLWHTHPSTADLATPAGLAGIRDEVMARFPERHFDFTFLRKATLRELARRCKCPEEALVSHGFDLFWQARNRVELFADVEPVLAELAENYVLIALTNGNADLELVGLERYFDHYLNAISVGAPKPEPQMFLAAAAAADVSPEQVLHVGDHPLQDVEGARAAGMRCAWMDRFGRDWPSDLAAAEFVARDLHELHVALTWV